MLKHVSHADRPLCFPRRIPFYCSFTSLQRWRLQCGNIVPASSMAIGHFIILMVQSRADWERMLSLWPKPQTGDSPNKKKKKRKKRKGKPFCGERSSEEWGMDVSYQHQYHPSLDCSNSTAIQLESTQQLLHLIANSSVHVLFFIYLFFAFINSVQIDVET